MSVYQQRGNVSDGGRASSMPGEKLDCSVRAAAIALDIPYPDAHALFTKHGRKPRHRTPTRVSYIALSYTKAHSYTYTKRRPTLERFVREHPEGRYIIRVRGHMFTVIDGGIHDLLPWPSPRALVLSYWYWKAA